MFLCYSWHVWGCVQIYEKNKTFHQKQRWRSECHIKVNKRGYRQLLPITRLLVPGELNSIIAGWYHCILFVLFVNKLTREISFYQQFCSFICFDYTRVFKLWVSIYSASYVLLKSNAVNIGTMCWMKLEIIYVVLVKF